MFFWMGSALDLVRLGVGASRDNDSLALGLFPDGPASP